MMTATHIILYIIFKHTQHRGYILIFVGAHRVRSVVCQPDTSTRLAAYLRLMPQPPNVDSVEACLHKE